MDLKMDFVDSWGPYGGKQHVLNIYLSVCYLFVPVDEKQNKIEK